MKYAFKKEEIHSKKKQCTCTGRNFRTKIYILGLEFITLKNEMGIHVKLKNPPWLQNNSENIVTLNEEEEEFFNQCFY